MEDELKPCPYCGEPVYYELYGDTCDVVCRNKKCFMCNHELVFVDPQKWNRRPEVERLQAENARLRAALEQVVGYDAMYSGKTWGDDIKHLKDIAQAALA